MTSSRLQSQSLSSSSMPTLSVLPVPLTKTLTLTLAKRSSSAKHFVRCDSRQRLRLKENRAESSQSQVVASLSQIIPKVAWTSEAIPLGRHLEEFYEKVVRVDSVARDIALVSIDKFLSAIYPRLTKLAKGLGLRVFGFVKTGSLFDDTCVVTPTDVDVLVLFRCRDVTSFPADPGYVVIPLESEDEDRTKRDRWRFGRSADDGDYLSSRKVARSLYDLLKMVLSDKSLDGQLRPFLVEEGQPQITIVLQSLTLHISPACSPTRDHDDTYLVCRPYPFDVDPASATLWRLHFPGMESKILSLMERSDGGVRKQSLKIMKAIVKQDEGLRGLSSYHIKTVLLRAFDLEVDKGKRWQSTNLESAFLALLTDLRDCLDEERLPHFYEPRFNLFGNVPSRILARWKQRVSVMIEDHSWIVRCLRRRIAEHNRKQAFLAM